MINYIIQVLLFQTVFMAVYDLILKKETFFQWNRAYLIVTSLLAYTIPLFKFSSFSERIPNEYKIPLPEVMISPKTFIYKHVESSVSLFNELQWIYFLGILIAFFIIVHKLSQLFYLIHQNPKEKFSEYNLVLIPDQNTAFSFFNYIFLGKITLNKKEIIQHELIHIKQKHSIDLLFFEIQKVVFWFSPYSYIYQKRIAEIHEFIADIKTVNKKKQSTFFNRLLSETFEVDTLTFVNSFNKHSFIKNRIIMFSKDKSPNRLKFKYLWLIPILIGMVIYNFNKNNSEIKISNDVLEKYSMQIETNEVIPNFRSEKKYNKLRTFLNNNPNYIVWIDTDSRGNEYIEVHHESEIPPEGFVLTSSKFNTGKSNIKMYYNLKNYKKS